MDDAKIWIKRLAPYKKANNLRAIFEIIITLVPFIGLWLLMLWSLHISYVLTLLISVLAAFFTVRLFIIQHDCGHDAFFSSRKANHWVGRVLGVLTFTPFDFWRDSHARHHAGSGNLDRRGIGDIDTYTLKEYQALDWKGRFQYRLYRHPVIMFILGPAFLFIFDHRLPVGAMRGGMMPWLSTMSTNLGILIVSFTLISFVGWQSFLLVQVPIIVLAASLGVWLFYVQHQFEHTHWEKTPNWSHTHAALHGSSFYDLPLPLMWLTGFIGVHHVHHISSRIPFHALPSILRDFPELKNIGRLTFWQSLKCVRLTLWDEERKLLISFREAKAQA